MRSQLHVDAIFLADALAMLRVLRINVVGSAPADDGRIALCIEGPSVPDVPLVSIEFTLVTGEHTVTLEARCSPVD